MVLSERPCRGGRPKLAQVTAPTVVRADEGEVRRGARGLLLLDEGGDEVQAFFAFGGNGNLESKVKCKTNKSVFG